MVGKESALLHGGARVVGEEAEGWIMDGLGGLCGERGRGQGERVRGKE